jgi:hypothetical protein
MMRIAAGILAAVLMSAAQADAPRIRIERGESCVAPVAEMRRDHMKMLLHQRDRTLRQGLREPRFSLKGCVDCHASRKTGSVLGKDGFCSSCHEYAAVRIDCFECHSPHPRKQAAARP